jgi:hypothetical protein
MDDLSEDQLKRAVEAEHGGTARLAQTVPIDKHYGGLPIWRGAVYIFDLEGSPSGAARVYAWCAVADGEPDFRLFTVPHLPPITSPVDAVRAVADASPGEAGKR